MTQGQLQNRSSGSLGTGCLWTTLAFWEWAVLVPDGSLAFCLASRNPRIPADCKSVREIFRADPSQSQCPGVGPQAAAQSCRQCLCRNPNSGRFQSSAAPAVPVWKCGTPILAPAGIFVLFFLSLGAFYLYI